MSLFTLPSYLYWRARYLYKAITWEANIAIDIQKKSSSSIPAQAFHDAARDCMVYIFLTEQLDLQMACMHLFEPRQRRVLLASGKTKAHLKTLMKAIQTRKDARWEATAITFDQNKKEPNAQYFFRSLAAPGFPVQTPDKWMSLLQEKRHLDHDEARTLVDIELNNLTQRLIKLTVWSRIDPDAPIGTFQRNFYELFRAYASVYKLEQVSFQGAIATVEELIQSSVKGLARSSSVYHIWVRAKSSNPNSRDMAISELADFIHDSNTAWVKEQQLQGGPFDYATANTMTDYNTCMKIAFGAAQVFDTNRGPIQ